MKTQVAVSQTYWVYFVDETWFKMVLLKKMCSREYKPIAERESLWLYTSTFLTELKKQERETCKQIYVCLI